LPVRKKLHVKEGSRAVQSRSGVVATSDFAGGCRDAMVVAGQVDVLPFQPEAFAGLYPPDREGSPTSTHGNGTSLRDARESYS
jgi:hypothetical protein